MQVRKIKSVFLFILMGALFANCSIEEPVLPSWMVPLSIPIASDTLLFQNEIANGNSIITSGDTLCINIEGNFDPETISENELTISENDTTISIMLGTISLDSIRTESANSIELIEILPLFSLYVGQSVTVPETTVTSDPMMVGSDEFSGAIIRECVVRVCVYNEMPFAIGPNSYSPDGMEIGVYDSTGALVTDVTINYEIPSGGWGCVEKLITPGDSWVRAPLRLDYSIPVARDTTFDMTQGILDNSSCRLTVTLLDLDIKEIIGKIPSQNITSDHRLPIGNGSRIIEGSISSGFINIDFLNRIPIGIGLDITVPDLKSPENISYNERLFLAQEDVASFGKNLCGYKILNYEYPGIPLDSLLVDIGIVTEESVGFVHLKDTDSVAVTIHTDKLEFSRLEGDLAIDSLEIGPFEENDIADYKGFSGSLNFEKALLLIAFHNDLNIENVDLNLFITGYHRETDGRVSDSAGVAINAPIAFGDNILSISDQRIVDLLNIYPTDIVSTGVFVYSGYSVVAAGDGISGGYSLSTPFEVEIRDSEPVEFDPDTLSGDDIGGIFRDAVGDNIQSAVLKARIENHSPIGGEVRLFISCDPSRVQLYDTRGYSDSNLEFIKTITMDAAPVDPLNGFIESAAVSEVEFPLTYDELLIFADPPVYTGFQLILEETAGTIVIRGSDYIEFSGEIELEILIHGEE
ncbi:hypothetical protein J7M07_03065 [bacterium]|nr:hypothetical protein [bacterium]